MVLFSLLYVAFSAAIAAAASLQRVTNFGNNPTGINMHIYVPDRVAADPAIIVAVRGEIPHA